ncbi:MAG: hypothetical protein K8W52_22260 [Deltaproteobacteria bacterium]|nr:hypothetical protein [Deltaproteobacteria bacterium]
MKRRWMPGAIAIGVALADAGCLDAGDPTETTDTVEFAIGVAETSVPMYFANPDAVKGGTVLETTHDLWAAGMTLRVDTCTDRLGYGGDSTVDIGYLRFGTWTPLRTVTDCAPGACGAGHDDVCASFTAPFPMTVVTRTRATHPLGGAGSVDYRSSVAPLDANGMLTDVYTTFGSQPTTGVLRAFAQGTGFTNLDGNTRHIQGVVRLPRDVGFPWDFVLSTSWHGELDFARIDSRRPGDANRFGATAADPARDRTLLTTSFPGIGDPTAEHAGGLARAGQFLFVPVEPRQSGAHDHSEVVVFDLGGETPDRLYSIPRTGDGASAVGVAKLGHNAAIPFFRDRQVLVVGGDSAATLDFYVKPMTPREFSDVAENTQRPWERVMHWRTAVDTRYTTMANNNTTWTLNGEGNGYQNLALLAQVDGALYLLGLNDHVADLWRVRGQGEQVRQASGVWVACPTFLCLEKADSKTVAPAPGSGTWFRYGGDAYVVATGFTLTDKLIMYETDNNPFQGLVKLSEL